MDILAAITPLSVVSGFIVGLLVGLTGVGGGSLMTPLLILLFGVHATTAVGTDLLYAAATKGAGSITHGLRKTVDWQITARLAAGSLPGAVLTIGALYRFGITGGASPRLITMTLGVALLASAAAVLARPWIRRMTDRHATRKRATVPLTLVAGLGHWLLGSVDWGLLMSLLLGSVPGITLGSHMSARLPERILRPVLAAVLVVVGLRMLSV